MPQASMAQAETPSDFTGCFVWHELASPDPEAAIKFYSRVLGWTATPVPEMSYTVMSADGQEVGGIRSAFPQEPQAWGGYIGTKDVDGTAKRIAQSGGNDLPRARRYPGHWPLRRGAGSIRGGIQPVQPHSQGCAGSAPARHAGSCRMERVACRRMAARFHLLCRPVRLDQGSGRRHGIDGDRTKSLPSTACHRAGC